MYPFGFAPQGVQIPYVTWTLVSGQPTNRLTGPSAADALRVQVDCWGANGKAALQVAEAVRTAAQGWRCRNESQARIRRKKV